MDAPVAADPAGWDVPAGPGGGADRGIEPASGGWWRAIERAWLDPVAPPLLERAAAAGWRADEAGSYCGQCGATAEERWYAGAGCEKCRSAAQPFDRAVRLGEYRGELARWVREVKFGRWRRLGVDLGRLLGRSVAAELLRAGHRTASGADGSARPTRVVVVPVPMPWMRRVSRGIDHTAAIGDGVAAALRQGGWSAEVRRLLRRRGVAGVGRSQVRTSKAGREANVRGTMLARGSGWLPAWLPGWVPGWVPGTGAWSGLAQGEGAGGERTVLVVVDDVITTGATMRAAARVVRRAARRRLGPERDGWELWAAALAVTPDRAGEGDREGEGSVAGE